MAYFRCSLGGGSGNGAVITVTYGAEFYNQTFVATNNVDTVSVVATSSGTVDIDVPSEGSWVVSCTIGADTYTSDTVVVDLTYSTSLTALPDGSTVLPTDDIQKWLECAGITDKAYTTLAEVLADTDTYTTLLGDSNACDYMARSTTWASTIVADADAMRLLGMYDYACDALLSDSTWNNAICGSTYFESVLDVKVPTMTSDTTPSGEVIYSSQYSSNYYYGWKAFDNDNSTRWAANGAAPQQNQYVGYHFTEPVIVVKASIRASYVNSYTRLKNYHIDGSNDGTTWTTLYTGLVQDTSSAHTDTVSFSNDTAYSYYRVYGVDNYASLDAYSISIDELQFYGRHEAQTDIIVSAPSDTIYYMDNGSPVTLCTTDASGVGTVDWSDLPTGDITLYSSVAKNPTDLTADYSKTIKVSKFKTQAYLMPDATMYWYGYEVAPIDGYALKPSGSSSSYTAAVPTITRNTNDMHISMSTNSTGGTTSNSQIFDFSKYDAMCSIAKASSTADSSAHIRIIDALSANYTALASNSYTATDATWTYKEADISSITSSGYMATYTTKYGNNDRYLDIEAFWLE